MLTFQEALMEVLKKELEFVFKCKGSTKPVRKKQEEEEEEIAVAEAMYGSNIYNYNGKSPLT